MAPASAYTTRPGRSIRMECPNPPPRTFCTRIAGRSAWSGTPSGLKFPHGPARHEGELEKQLTLACRSCARRRAEPWRGDGELRGDCPCVDTSGDRKFELGTAERSTGALGRVESEPIPPPCVEAILWPPPHKAVDDVWILWHKQVHRSMTAVVPPKKARPRTG
eukprot:scaffold143264_cov31-Tisochrysis_lutea.AAC.1